MLKFPPPQSENELMQRANALAGLTLSELAELAKVSVPKNLLKDKGWSGQLLELILGASAKSLPIPDFPHLGIELKTIPVSELGKPLETTFVCVAPLKNITGLQWQQSGVYQKLKRVLWIPIVAERKIAVSDRMLGTPIIWSPTTAQERLLREDWEEIMEKIAFGQINKVNATLGQVLQLRPKAANNKAVTQAIDAQGKLTQALPRGFYLKTHFTGQILQSLTQ